MIEAEQAQANSRVIHSGFMLEMTRWNNLVEVLPGEFEARLVISEPFRKPVL